MSSVDNRIVEMQFDNQQFEKGIRQSRESLEGLKKDLELNGASNGLRDIEKTAKNFSLSGIEAGVENLTKKFSTLGVIGVTAIQNFTNSAIDAGKRLLSSLTVDNISAGWSKFGDKTVSVGTLVSQGYDLNTVNEQMERLNWFTDETSYNFVDMVSNIAKFTATGQKLEPSVTALEGIATWAALSGQNASTASHAMYQLSQAMGAGVMRKEDYKSIQNVSMDTDEFRQKALDAAVALGTLKENIDGTYTSLVNDKGAFTKGQFAEHLTEDAWFTSDVMMKVFNDYSAAVDQIYDYAQEKGLTASEAIEELGDSVDQFGLKAFRAAQEARTWADVVDSVKDAVSTGWMNTFEYIFGDYEEAKNLWTDLANTMYDVFASGGESRNELLSESLSSGWKQLLKEGISDAEDFKESIKSVAREQISNFDEMIESAGSFEESLKSGWLTSDILSEALTKLVDKTRGLSDEEIEATGYTRKQIDSLEALERSVKDGSVSLEEYAEKMKNLSGRENLIESVKNVFKGLASIVDPIKEAFRDIFPPMTAEKLYSITSSVEKLTEKFKIGTTTSENLKRTFKGVFALFDIGARGAKTLISGFTKLIGYILPIGDGFLGVTAGIGDFIVGIDNAIKSSDAFNGIVSGIGSVLKPFGDMMKNFGKSVAESFSNIGESGPLKSFLNFINNAIPKISDGMSKFGTVIGQAFEKIRSAFSETFNPLMSLANGGILAAALFGLKKFMDKLSDIADNGPGLLNGIRNVLDCVKDSLESWQSSIKSGVLMKIAMSIGILAAAVMALSLIDPQKLAFSIGAITAMFVDLFVSMGAFEKIMDGSGFKSISKVSKAMISVSIAVLILTAAMKKLSELKWNEIAKGLVGVGGLSSILVGVAKILSTNSKKMIKGATGLIAFAAAINIMVRATKSLSELDWGPLLKGLVGVGILCAEIAAFMRISDSSKIGVTKSIGFIALAGAIVILSNAVEKLSGLNLKELAKGLGGVGVLLAELALFMNFTGDVKRFMSTALGLTVLGAAVLIFAEAITRLGSLSIGQIGKGLLAMAVALTEVIIALKFMPKNALSIGIGLITISTALVIMSSALQNMGGMSWEQIGKGLATLAGSLTIIAVAMNFMTSALPGAAALLIVAASLSIIAPVLMAFGSMRLSEIGKSMLVLAGTFTIFGVAGVALAPLTPILLALGAAIALFGVGCAAVGVGLLAFSTGLMALSVSGAAGAAALVGIITDIVSLIPMIGEQLGKGIIAFASAIGDGAVVIGDALKKIILSAIDVLSECVPEIADGIIKILIAVFQSVSENIPELIQAAADIFGAIFDGIIDAINTLDPDVLIKGVIGLGILTGLMFALSAVTSVIPAAMIGVLGIGAVVAEMALILAAIGALAQIPGLDWLIGEGGKLLENIGTSIGLFIGGIIGGAIGGITNSLPDIGNNLSDFMTSMTPFLEGAASIDSSMLDGVKTLADTILILTGASLLDGITSWLTGGSSLSDFAEQLIPFGEALTAYSNSVDGLNSTSVTNSVEAAKALVELADSIPNDGGVLGFFVGNNDIGTFGENVKTFGSALKDYGDSVNGLNTAAISISTSAANNLIEIAKKLSGVKLNKNDFKSLGDGLKSLGKAMSEYSGKISGVDEGKVKSAINSILEIIKMADKLSEANLSTLSGFGDALKKAANASIDDFISAFNDVSSVSKDIGSKLIDGLKSGLESQQSSLTVPSKALREFIAKELKKGKEDAKTAGNNIVQGLINGMNEKRGAATAAATQLAKGIVTAMKSALVIQSPSKVMRDEVGNYIVEGVAEGIKKNMSAEEAAEKKAQNIKDAFQKEFDKIDLDISRIDLDKQLREAQNPNMSIVEKATSDVNALWAKRGAYAQKFELASAEYEETVKHLGAASVAAIEAEQKAIKAQIELLNVENEIHATIEKSYKDQLKENTSLLDTIISNSEKEYKLWKLLDGKGASISEDATRHLATISEQISQSNEKVYLLGQEMNRIASEYGTDSAEYMQAYGEYLDGRIELEEKKDELESTVEQSYKDQLERSTRTYDAISQSADKEYQLWKLINRKNTSIADDSAKQIEKINKQISQSNEKVYLLGQEMKRIAEKYGYDSLEYMEARNKYVDEWVALEEKKAEVFQVNRDRNQRELNVFKQHMDIEEKRLALWESLYDGVVSTSQVTERRVEGVTKKINEQKSVVDLLRQAYRDTCDVYGEGSEEANDKLSELIDGTKTLIDLEKELSQVILNGYANEISAIESRRSARDAGYDFRSSYYENSGDEGKKNRAELEKLASTSSSLADQWDTAWLAYNDALFHFSKGSPEEREAYKNLMSIATDIVNTDKSFSELLETETERNREAGIKYSEFMSSTANGMRKIGGVTEEMINTAAASFGYNSKGITFELDPRIKGILTQALGVADYDMNFYPNPSQEMVEAHQDVGGLMVDEVCLGIQNENETGEKTGSKIVDVLIDGVQNRSGDVKQAGEDVGEAFIDGVESVEPEVKKAGNSLLISLVSGINSNASAAYNAAVDVTNDVIDGVRDTSDMHSPSKVFIGLGKYIVLGFANGLSSYAYLAERSSADMGNRTIDSMRNTISGISSIIADGVDAEPTIRPVIDMSNVSSGLGELDNMLSYGRTLSFGGASRRHLNSISSRMDKSQTVLANNNSDVVEAVGSLGGRIDKLGEAVKNMKIILDSGTLVGKLSDPMDKTLGRKAIYKGRGI